MVRSHEFYPLDYRPFFSKSDSADARDTPADIRGHKNVTFGNVAVVAVVAVVQRL